MAQVECDVCRGLVAARRIGLEAAQDHLLEPGRDALGARLRRRGVHPEAIAKARHGERRAEWQLARGELVEHHAERKEVAAAIGARAENLLGRNVGRAARRIAPLLRQQVGQQAVVGEGEIEEDRAAVGAHEDVVRLQVEVHHVLRMDRVQRVADGRADACHLRPR